jgi:hypothetical protein
MQFICEGEEVIYTNMVGKGEQCDGCGLQFPVIKNIHGPKQFKGVTLCPDCYDIPEIKKETSNAFRVLLHDDIATRKTGCDICGIILIDAQSAKRVRYFERDHIDPATKTQSVGYMCMRGDPMQVILNENRLCRNLCISCHSVVTYVERQSGCLVAAVQKSPMYDTSIRMQVQDLARSVAMIATLVKKKTIA